MHERLIFTSLGDNHNKFWFCELNGSTVSVHFGRVGDPGQKMTHSCDSDAAAEKKFNSLVRSKLNKGYTRLQTLAGELPVNASRVAKVQIGHGNDAETMALIDFLIKRNIHNIEGMTGIRLESGKLTTPLGPVTAEGLDAAQALLNQIALQDAEFEDLVNRYLRIVPRVVSRRGGVVPAALFGTADKVEAEQALIDSLKAVVKDLEQKAETSEVAPVFQTKLEVVSGAEADYRRIERLFKGGLNRNHRSYGMGLAKVWRMSIESADKAFEAKVGNIRELWHGTADANLLSLLKSGFVIPKRSSTIRITGRMFGDGVYFSDQSTKSLNYAGNYWGGTGSQRTFMLLNDVAMGREYTPLRGFSGSIPSGYDSCFAKAGRSGVINNEMIVYRTSQIKPTFLCEFR